MNYCTECGRNLQNKKYYCDSCLAKYIKGYIFPIKPTYLNDKWCQDLFPKQIFENMSNYFQKDIDDLILCLQNQIWVPAVLMSARILETQLKIHIEEDLNEDLVPDNIGECIGILSRNQYSKSFIDMVDELRDLRNQAMHGETRFNSQQALKKKKKVLAITVWIFNFC